MTQPARRPTTSTEASEIAFLGATSIPDPQSSPATPLPEIHFLHASTPPPPPPPAPVPVAQKQKHGKQRSRPGRLIRSVRAAFRSFPAIQPPSCRGMPSLHHLPGLHGGAVRNHFHGSTSATGTLYGHRRARITVAFHESPGAPPCLLLDIGVPTAKFIQDVSAAGMVRVTLECDKHHHHHHHAHAAEGSTPRRLFDEPVWTAEVNGESVGYASRREATERDERVMQLLHATSMGAGVLPADMSHPHDGELTYMRAHFDRVVGSKDAETYYMHNPEGGATGPELTIFFIRI
ncbi:hypothetical protein BS78_03G114600 [Paspalum vaginatum]|nr:hypothetical protein BS78_03G114600 [Paspalum vaginatum]